MSRLHRARVTVSDHSPGRQAAIRTALADWQDGAELVESTRPDGNPNFDLTFSLSGGWPMAAAAKSQAYRIGQANGAPCRVGWSAWWVEDGGELRVWWPADEPSPDVAGSDGEQSSARCLLVRLSVDPTDETKSDLANQLTSGWLTALDAYGHGVLDLTAGQDFVEQVRSWRQELIAQVGAHELTASAWDMDHPHEARLFTPDLFPLRDANELLAPGDPMMSWLPRDGRCMFCRDGTPLRLVGYRTLDPDPDLAAAGIQTLPGRQTVAVCAPCQATVAERLEHESETQIGLYETDGNPMGGLAVSPTLPCMTCERTVADALVIINDSLNLTACRQCLADARPLDWHAIPTVTITTQG